MGCLLCMQGLVQVNSDTGELKLLVKINSKALGAEGKKSKAVKDLKQLSGRVLGFLGRVLVFPG